MCYLMCVMMRVPNICFVHCRSLGAVLMRRAWSVTSEKRKKKFQTYKRSLQHRGPARCT